MTPPDPTASEREKVVKWLRGERQAIMTIAYWEGHNGNYLTAHMSAARAETIRLVADSLERGDHDKGGTDDEA